MLAGVGKPRVERQELASFWAGLSGGPDLTRSESIQERLGASGTDPRVPPLFEALQIGANCLWPILLAISNGNLSARALPRAAHAAMAPTKWPSNARWLPGRLTSCSRTRWGCPMPVAGSFFFIPRPR